MTEQHSSTNGTPSDDSARPPEPRAHTCSDQPIDDQPSLFSQPAPELEPEPEASFRVESLTPAAAPVIPQPVATEAHTPLATDSQHESLAQAAAATERRVEFEATPTPDTTVSAGVPAGAAAAPSKTASEANPYSIKKEVRRESTTRPDQVQAMKMVSRKQYLPTMYGLWWMATLVFFLIVAGLVAFHTLEYWGYDPLAIRFDDLQDKYVFLSLGASMLATLFFIWVLQNTAKGLTNNKANPETSYNNVYGVMLCLLIIGSMKMSSDVMAETTDARSGGQLQWLRDNAWGSDGTSGDSPTDLTATSTTPQVADSTTQQTDPEAAPPSNSTGAARVSPFASTSSSVTNPGAKPTSTTGRNLPQATPDSSGSSSGTQIRMGDPTRSVMASSMRAFQSAAGRARMADQRVMMTPQPDLASLKSADPIAAVAEAHLSAFEAHLELARIAATLPDTAKVQMLGAGASVARTEEQVASLRSLLSLDSAVTIQNAEAGVHGARAAYAGFLAQHHGTWSVKNGTVTFVDAELGATAVDLQKAIGQRETELKAARYDAATG